MKTLGLLLAGFLLVSLLVGAGEVITNDTGEDARGLSVTFSSPVLITGFGDSLPNVDPLMMSYEFIFSGGVVEPWGSQWMNWAPATATLLNYEWLTHAEQDTAEAASDLRRLSVEELSTGFGGTSIDYCLWDIWAWNGGEASQSDRAVLSTNRSSEFSSAKLITQYWLEGDFDVQVDFELLDGWDDRIAGSGGYPRLSTSLGVYVDDATLVDFACVRSGNALTLNVYSALGSGALVESRTTSGDSGTLRAERTGSVLILSTRSGGSWREIARTTFVTNPVRIYLNSASLEVKKDSTTSFDNFVISEGTPTRYAVPWDDDYEYDPDFAVGGWICDYFAHREWNRFWDGTSPLEVMSENGFEWARVWVTMTSSQYLSQTNRSDWSNLPWRSEYWSSLEYATEIMREAQDLGMRINAVLTLSPTAAHAGQQIPPDGWSGLSVEETCDRLEAYAYDTATHFQNSGINVEIYDIGNEIDWGVLGFRPGERLERPAGVDQVRNMTYMEQSIWPTEAELLEAAIRGIRRANPNARIALHVAGALDLNTDVAGSFFEFMDATGVDFDIAGFSLPYPENGWSLNNYSRECWYSRVNDLVVRIAATDRQVFISECSYPSSSRGITASPMPDYPFTPEGQAKWVHDALRFAKSNPLIDGFFYFYPDWFPGMSTDTGTWNVQSYGLFATDGVPQPAMYEFGVNLPQDSE